MVEVQYGLRLDAEDKKAFEELCRRNSVSMAQAIKDFIQRANQAGQLEITDEIAASSPDDLAEIRDRLEALEENQGHLAPEDLARLEKMIGESLFPALLSRLEKLEMAIGGMSGRSSDSSEKQQAHKTRAIPQGFTHLEIAKQIGSSERTVQRLSKDMARWPEGYHWSDESKKWFQVEGSC